MENHPKEVTKSTLVTRDTRTVGDATKAIEEALLIIKEYLVLDDHTEKLNSLTLEVQALKVSLQSERQVTEDLRKALSDSEERNSKLATKIENSTKKASLQSERQVTKDLRKALSESEDRNLKLTTKLENATKKESQELLLKCISQNLGYVESKPVAACVIYKCLLQWKSFECDGTSIFHLIIDTIVPAIQDRDNNEIQAYWLSNLATLSILLLHRRLKYPAQVFKGKLIVLLGMTYQSIRENLRQEISPLLNLCIESPRTSRTNAVARQKLIGNWQTIRRILNTYLTLLKANNVPPFLVRKVFTQVFSFINVQLFNSFLLRRECCSFTNGECVKQGLVELQKWCVEATSEYAGPAWDELKHTRKTVDFLIIREKPKKTLEELKGEFFPVLNIQHLYIISTMFPDDGSSTHGVSSNVIDEMKVELDNVVSNSLVLDEDSSVPFAVEDISNSMGQVDVNINIQPLHKMFGLGGGSS